VQSLDREELLAALHQRIRLMHESYGQGELELSELGEESLGCLEILEEYYVGVPRYSSRQKRKLEMRGILGSYILQDASRDLLKWLLVVSVLNLGKSSSFALGQIGLSFLEEPEHSNGTLPQVWMQEVGER